MEIRMDSRLVTELENDPLILKFSGSQAPALVVIHKYSRATHFSQDKNTDVRPDSFIKPVRSVPC